MVNKYKAALEAVKYANTLKDLNKGFMEVSGGFNETIQTALRLADRLQSAKYKAQERTLVDNSHGGGKYIWDDVDLIKECE